jgi:hypothetical protein
MSDERPAFDLRRTPYQLTLSALIVPWRLHTLLNAVTGVAFGLVAGPVLAMLWVACLTLGDAVLQRQYRRLEARSALADSNRGLRRLAWVGSVKGVLWISAPTAFAVLTRSAGGLAFVAVTAILLTALAASTFRNSRLMFLSVAIVPIAALAICIVAVFGAPGRRRPPDRARHRRPDAAADRDRDQSDSGGLEPGEPASRRRHGQHEDSPRALGSGRTKAAHRGRDRRPLRLRGGLPDEDLHRFWRGA